MVFNPLQANSIVNQAGLPSTTGTGRPSMEDFMARGNVLQQQNVVNNLGREAQYFNQGEEVETESPGLLSKVFDILSRPNYAVANFTSRLLDNDTQGGIGGNVTDALAGGFRGFTGEEKTTFSDVLEQEGVENGWIRGIAGFGLDVLLDPTTYLSGGLSAGSKLDDLGRVGKAIDKAAKGRRVGGPTGIVINRAEEALESIRNLSKTNIDKETIQEFMESSGTAIEDITDSGSLKAFKKGVKDYAESREIDRAFSVVDDAVEGAERELLPEVELRFLGKRIGGIQEPVGFNEWRNRVNNGPLNWVNRAFSTKYLLPDGMRDLMTEHVGRQVGWADLVGTAYRRQIKDLGLSSDELTQVTRALESGVHPGDGPMGEAYEATRGLLDHMFDLEVSMGLADEGSKLDNYIPHIYKSDPERTFREAVSSGATISGEAKLKASRNRKFNSLSEAAEAGYEPIEDITALIGHRLQDHQQAMARAGFLDSVRSNFGFLPEDVYRSADDLPFPEAEDAVKVLESDLPADIPGISDQTRRVRKKIKQQLQERGFVEHKFKVYDAASGAVQDVTYMIPKRIKESLGNIERLMTNSATMNEFTRGYDKAHGYWKAFATVMNPGHHARNMIGDAFMSWEGGGFNPTSVADAIRAILPDRQIRDWREAAGLIGLDTPASNFVRIGTRNVPLQDIYRQFREEGLGSGFFNAEITTSRTGLFEPARKFSSDRENVTRLAHFMTRMKKGAKKIDGEIGPTELKKLAREAAASTRKWLIDYSDLTPFEMGKVKKVSSFYTFMRKNLPLQLESAFLQPGKISTVPKASRAIEEALGTSDIDARIENRIPDWMREEGNILVAGGDTPRTINLGLPVAEAFDRFSGVLAPQPGSDNPWDIAQAGTREALNASNPLLKAIAEIGTGRSAFTGGPVDEDLSNYLQELIPAGRVLGAQGVGQDRDPRAAEVLRNWFTGAPTQTATYQRQEAELRRQEDVLRTVLDLLSQPQTQEN